MSSWIEQLTKPTVIPVVTVPNDGCALPLADALEAGGLQAAEITFRTDAAEDAIRRIRAAKDDFLLLAGTVLTTEQADRAMAAGAAGIVSPGLNPRVVEHCLKKGYPVTPGVCTPSEVELALSFGLDRVKFFPAEAAGGIAMIKAMAAPYGTVRFMPTGGISPDNLAAYLSCPAVFACGGSWMVPQSAVVAGDFAEIQKLTAEAVALIKEITA